MLEFVQGLFFFIAIPDVSRVGFALRIVGWFGGSLKRWRGFGRVVRVVRVAGNAREGGGNRIGGRRRFDGIRRWGVERRGGLVGREITPGQENANANQDKDPGPSTVRAHRMEAG